MKIHYLIGAVFAGCLLMASAASAEPNGPRWETRKEFREAWQEKVNAIYTQLDLSAEQQQQLKDNRDRYQTKRENLFHKSYEARQALNAQLQNPDLDVDKMRTLHGQIKELKLAREDLRFESLLAVREILTAGQFQEFLRLKEDMRFRRGQNKTDKQE